MTAPDPIDELTGRALDEAAARAMGWELAESDSRWSDYSTDPAHIPEMLAWLRQRLAGEEDLVEIDIERCGIVCASSWARRDRQWNVVCGDGATISEALARLVVAVKESRR